MRVCRLLLMFASESVTLMRVTAVLAVTALITLVTAFDFEARDLLFNGDDELTVDEVLASEATPPTAASATAAAAEPSAVALTAIGEFAAPVDVIARPGDDRVFVVELMGTVTAAGDDTTGSVTVLDLSTQTLVEGERGLLGAAFHPVADLLYVHYSNQDGDSVIAEFAVDAATGIADVGSHRTVMVVEQPYANHNGGEVEFGPDGYLYLGFGDGGLADDPVRSALDLSSPLGKILRIDPEPTTNAAYSIPTDNPFVADASADPAIWSYGLRNPWKFSFDPATGDLWIADVGQNLWEEVNAARSTNGQGAGRGLSFGWSAFEGFERFNDDQAVNGHTDPFLSYERAEGKCSISGGAVARDDSVPELDGWYIFGDYCTGQIFGISSTGDGDQEPVQLAQVDVLVAIAAGPDGALYAASVAGPVYRIG